VKRPEDSINLVLDGGGAKISFYEDVPEILQMLHNKGRAAGADPNGKVIVAACSRTTTPDMYVFETPFLPQSLLPTA